MKGMFSYMAFTSSGSSIAARASLWCCLATVAHKLLLYSCAQRLMSEWGWGGEMKRKRKKCSYLPDVLEGSHMVRSKKNLLHGLEKKHVVLRVEAEKQWKTAQYAAGSSTTL